MTSVCLLHAIPVIPYRHLAIFLTLKSFDTISESSHFYVNNIEIIKKKKKKKKRKRKRKIIKP